MIGQETLRLIVPISRSFLLLNTIVLSTLSTTEDKTPEEDEDMANNHTDKTSSDTNNNPNKDWYNDVESNATEESSKCVVVWASVSVVGSVWACVVELLWSAFDAVEWTRSAMSLAPSFSTSLLHCFDLTSDDCSPLAEKGGAFLSNVSRPRNGARGLGDLRICEHELFAGGFDKLEVDCGDSVDELISYFDDLEVDGDDAEAVLG